MAEQESQLTSEEPTAELASAQQAFEAVASERRLSVLTELVDEQGHPRTRTFTELFEASDADTTAGFAYHLRQLDGTFVRETDAEYTLTYAGRTVLDAIDGGEFTEVVDRDPIELEESCPLCGSASLTAQSRDNVLTVRCSGCDRSVLSVPSPPAAFRTHTPDELPEAIDAQHRHRIELAVEGVCPTCGGPIDAGIDQGAEQSTLDVSEEDRSLARLRCQNCGFDCSVPVTLCVRDHPAVIAFYHEHGIDVRDRPLWNVGEEWRETVVSTDPWVYVVSTRLEEQTLTLYVDEELTVRETRCTSHDRTEEECLGEGDTAEGDQSATGSA
jgi:hypothetical protein